MATFFLCLYVSVSLLPSPCGVTSHIGFRVYLQLINLQRSYFSIVSHSQIPVVLFFKILSKSGFKRVLLFPYIKGVRRRRLGQMWQLHDHQGSRLLWFCCRIIPSTCRPPSQDRRRMEEFFTRTFERSIVLLTPWFLIFGLITMRK